MAMLQIVSLTAIGSFLIASPVIYMAR